MSKYYSPRDYDVIGFGNNRRYIPITDEERRKRAAKRTKKKKLTKQKHQQEMDLNFQL